MALEGLPIDEITDRFLMNGKALCLMSMEMFCKRVPLGGKMLYKDFQIRLSIAINYKKRCYYYELLGDKKLNCNSEISNNAVGINYYNLYAKLFLSQLNFYPHMYNICPLTKLHLPISIYNST